MHGPLTASRESAAGSVKSSLCGGGHLSFSALRRCGILYGGLHAHSAASTRLTEQAIYQDEKKGVSDILLAFVSDMPQDVGKAILSCVRCANLAGRTTGWRYQFGCLFRRVTAEFGLPAYKHTRLQILLI